MVIIVIDSSDIEKLIELEQESEKLKNEINNIDKEIFKMCKNLIENKKVIENKRKNVIKDLRKISDRIGYEN